MHQFCHVCDFIFPALYLQGILSFFVARIVIEILRGYPSADACEVVIQRGPFPNTAPGILLGYCIWYCRNDLRSVVLSKMDTRNKRMVKVVTRNTPNLTRETQTLDSAKFGGHPGQFGTVDCKSHPRFSMPMIADHGPNS